MWKTNDTDTEDQVTERVTPACLKNVWENLSKDNNEFSVNTEIELYFFSRKSTINWAREMDSR